MINGNQFPQKDPAEVLDYQFDWAGQSNNTGKTDWLEDGETIVSWDIDVPVGITLVSSALVNEATSVLFWLSGGIDKVDYPITCTITTQTRTAVRTGIVPVRYQ